MARDGILQMVSTINCPQRLFHKVPTSASRRLIGGHNLDFFLFLLKMQSIHYCSQMPMFARQKERYRHGGPFFVANLDFLGCEFLFFNSVRAACREMLKSRVMAIIKKLKTTKSKRDPLYALWGM